MVKGDDWKSPLLIEAVRVWTGWGQEAMPRRDDSSLVSHFGAKVASDLLPVIRSLVDDFYASDAKYTAADLSGFPIAPAAVPATRGRISVS